MKSPEQKPNRKALRSRKDADEPNRRRMGEGNVPEGDERPAEGEYGNKERRQRQGGRDSS